MSAITDLLALVEVEVPEADAEAWDEETCDAVENWAANAYLQASDNDVEVPARPAVLAPYVEMTKLKEHLRLSLTRFIGDPMPTQERLREACDHALARMSDGGLIPSGCTLILRMTMEVGFGLRDPKELIDALEALHPAELKALTDTYGPGPDGIFMLADLKRRGEVDYVVTGHRPGLLEMDVTFKQPLRWIKLDVVLKD